MDMTVGNVSQLTETPCGEDFPAGFIKYSGSGSNSHPPRSMAAEQEEHLARIKAAIITTVDAKYRKGQAEHGGNLYEMSLATALVNILLEQIDGLTYTLQAMDEAGVPVREVLDAIQFGHLEVAAPHHGA